MAANPSNWAVDFATYLRFERDAEERHELIDGEIVAMAGASRRHNVLCERLRDAIRPSLGEGPCILHGSDQRLGVLTADRGWVGYYPDLAVYCNQTSHVLDADTLVALSLIVEVTSKTTEKKDRGIKLDDYRQMNTLDECVIVSHERIELEVWQRGVGGWTRRLVTEGTATLKVGALLDLARLYKDLPA